MGFRMIGSAAMACAVVLLSSSGAAGELTKWVCPFSGTVGAGNTIPGACRPFGMVQPGPDTVGLDNPSGYERDQAAIRGFSATHLNGTGCAALGDVVLMPFTGGTDGVDFSSAWNRENERAEPGYYAVKLDRFGTSVEITATERVALFRFTWPDGVARKLLVDGASFLRDAWYAKEGPSIPWSKGAVSADRKEISGGRAFVSWTKAETYYAVRFAEPAASVTALPKDAFEGAGDRWICDFGEGGALEVRVAVSSVSEDGAKANLEEAGGKDFATVRAEADAEWESYLARATAEGDDEQKRNFYTSLYRLFIQPNNLADVDGRYRGADGEIHVAKDGRYYTTLSLWDTFRAAHPLYTLIASERVPGLVDTFLAHARQHGHLPVWSLWGREAHCMIGMPAIPVLADAWAKGFRGFDAEEALGMMVRSMTASDRCWPKMDWASFWEHGYYPYAAGPFDKGFVKGESVSRTLECAYDWWCIAHFARQIGAEATARKADRYAAAWKEVLDPATGFARGRGPDGSWRTPFDPLENSQAGEFFGDYTEANAWIYTWHVFQDPDGLAERLGGREKALAKLDEFFATKPVRTEKVGGNNDLGGVAGDGQIGQYWHGNEPSHHVAYLYTVWGEPAKAEALVKRICRESYKSSDHGLCGNDDCGQMSAWYVFSMLGLYPFNPCDGGYVLGAPQVPRGTLALPGGKRLEVVTENFGAGPVREVRLNGRRLAARHVSHADLIEGGELRFVMGEPADVSIDELHIRDPFVVTDAARGDYLVVSSIFNDSLFSRPGDRTDGFNFTGRGVMTFRTSDLKTLKEPKQVLSVPSELGCRAVWAPEMHRYRGKWYVFATLSLEKGGEAIKPMPTPGYNLGALEKRGTWIFVADTPEGPFRPVSDDSVTPPEWMCLDGTFFVDGGKPYIVFCHEWCQVGDGRMMLAELKADLSGLAGEPVELFRASVVGKDSSVTDGPFLYRSPKSGRLFMTWSNFVGGRYGVYLRVSDSGSVKGPWRDGGALFSQDGGHGMLFKRLDGSLAFTLHQPNFVSKERMKVFPVVDTGDTLKILENASPSLAPLARN